MSIIDKLKQGVLGIGISDVELRKRLFKQITADLNKPFKLDSTDEALNKYLEKVSLHAYKVMDKDINNLKETYSEDQLFELTVTTALANGIGRVEKVSKLLNDDSL